MGAIITRPKGTRRIRRIRLASQFAALVILSLPFLGLRTICGPAFHCYSCPLSAFACPLGVLVNFGTLRVFPYAAIGILGLVSTIGGRLICGWVCPFGLFQDGLDTISKKKVSIPGKLTYLRYAVLGGLVILVPLLPIKPYTYTFCNYCPAGTLESAIPWRIMGVPGGSISDFCIRLVILTGVVVLAVVSSRGFCRTLCPLGAIFSLFNRISLFRLNMTKEDCNQCGACAKVCAIGVDPATDPNAAACIRCLDCTATQHLRLGSK